MILFGVSDVADRDWEADGPRRKLPMIAALTLKRTAAGQEVWKVLIAGRCRTVYQQSTDTGGMCDFFGRGAAKRILWKNSAVL